MSTPVSPRILCIGATHGDEPIGVRALEELSKTETGFDWIVGNPPAFERGTRAFEGDLNRSAPGDAASPQYAPRRAAEILAKAKDYDWCVDIHGTTAYSGLFLILTKLTRENLALAARLNVRRIVYWPSISPELAGPLSEYFPCGLEIECGPKSMPRVERELKTVLREFLQQRKFVWSEQQTRDRLASRELYEVEGVCKTPRADLEEFVPAEIDGQLRVPLLVGQYAAQGVTCYTMRRRALEDWWR